MRFLLSLAFLVSVNSAYAHEMTPTYPELKPSFVEGIYGTSLVIFNRRKDINYYEISVFDNNWNPISFATSSKIIKINYLEKKYFDLYIRSKDLNRTKYICSTSKIQKNTITSATVASKICSKVK